MTYQEINDKLNSLVGRRFYTDGRRQGGCLVVKDLNKTLSQMFDTKVKVGSKYERESCVKKDLPGLDDQFLFSIENADIRIDVDLYYLKDNANHYYITETNFEFY